GGAPGGSPAPGASGPPAGGGGPGVLRARHEPFQIMLLFRIEVAGHRLALGVALGVFFERRACQSTARTAAVGSVMLHSSKDHAKPITVVFVGESRRLRLPAPPAWAGPEAPAEILTRPTGRIRPVAGRRPAAERLGYCWPAVAARLRRPAP